MREYATRQDSVDYVARHNDCDPSGLNWGFILALLGALMFWVALGLLLWYVL